MSKILFRSIRWKNFISTGNQWTEIPLDNKNHTLMIGKNGSGKSTFLDAISFALFNKPFRKINKPELVNSITGKECVVECEFNINTHHFKVVRGINPNIFEIYKNDELITQEAENRDYQDAFEKYILKINHKSFCQVVMLGSAVFTPFMQLPKAARRDIIEDLLDLQIFTTMNNLLKVKIQNTDKDISNLNNEKRLLEVKLEMIYKHIKEIQNNTDKIINEKKERLEQASKDISVLDHTVSVFRTLLSDLLEKTKDQDTLTERIKEMNKLQTQLQHKVKLLSKEMQFLIDNENCPTCKQVIDSSFKETAILEKSNDLQKIENGLVHLGVEFEKANARMTELLNVQNAINSANKQINENEIK